MNPEWLFPPDPPANAHEEMMRCLSAWVHEAHGIPYSLMQDERSRLQYLAARFRFPLGIFKPPLMITYRKPRTLDEIERDAIESALRRHRGNKPAVVAELGISLKTLYNKLHRYEQEKNYVRRRKEDVHL